MNSKELEMLENYEIKDNDEEDDKMEEKEISAQLNIIPQNHEFNQNIKENENIQNNEEENFQDINMENNNNNNYMNEVQNINYNYNEEINMNNNNGSHTEIKSMFENPILQTSYNLFTKLRRIIIRKENLTKINYFDKWIKNTKNISDNINDNNKDINENLEDNNNEQMNNDTNIQNRNVIQNILMSNEDNYQIPPSPNKSHNDVIIEHQNQLLKSGNQNFQMLINPFASINDMNFESDYPYINNNIIKNSNNLINIETNEYNENNDNNSYHENISNNNINNINISKEKKILCLSLVNVCENKLYYHFRHITQALKFRIIINNFHDKLFQMDRLNKKYESILDEKSSIIINKTDEIEDLKEKLDSVSKSLKDALKKQKSLNVIPESLCSKCGRSLEESFTSEALTENQKIIKEQNELIEKMKKEMNELRNKYNYAELRLKDLDEIKKEFENLSGVLLRPKIDNSVQTDNETELDTSFISTTTVNNTSNNNIKTMRNKNKNNKIISSKNQTILNKTKYNNTKKTNNTQQQKKVTNYNIININNNNNNTSIMSNTNNFMNSSNSNSNNNILSTELLNLNKEYNKLKNENKIIIDKNNKFEKEKKDILDKLKTKTETCEKYKKENAELIILINNSRYKNIIDIENENRKLKNTLEQIDNEIKNMSIINEKNEQKIKEQNIQMEKMKSIITKYNSFKEQKDNLLLANAKYEAEIKRLKYNLEQERDLGEKAKMLLKNNEEQIEKLNKEISYYTFHINKYKNDAAKALQDAIEYQQIVTALQSQINEYKVTLNKIKQNKKIQ